MKDGWHRHLHYLTELPDPLCHAISLAARDDKLVPALSLIYDAVSFFEPPDTRVVILVSCPSDLFWPWEAWQGLTPDFLSPAQWISQGVLLWSIRATMEEGKPLAHAGLGWEEETKKLLTTLSEKYYGIGWVLIGPEAHAYRSFIDAAGKHAVFCVPSPPDSLFLDIDWPADVNLFLERRGRGEIKW